jgi:hypothetical protein
MHEQPDGSDMVEPLLGKRQSLADQARDSLAHGVVEALDLTGAAGLLADRAMLASRKDLLV